MLLVLQVQSEIKRKWRRWMLQRFLGADTKYQQPSMGSNGNNFSTQITMMTKCSPTTRRTSACQERLSSIWYPVKVTVALWFKSLGTECVARIRCCHRIDIGYWVFLAIACQKLSETEFFLPELKGKTAVMRGLWLGRSAPTIWFLIFVWKPMSCGNMYRWAHTAY